MSSSENKNPYNNYFLVIPNNQHFTLIWFILCSGVFGQKEILEFLMIPLRLQTLFSIGLFFWHLFGALLMVCLMVFFSLASLWCQCMHCCMVYPLRIQFLVFGFFVRMPYTLLFSSNKISFSIKNNNLTTQTANH